MDPVSAFALSGTILQFPDTGTKFATLAVSLYRHESDTLTDHDVLSSIAKDLSSILPKLQPLGVVDDPSSGLSKLVKDCQRTTHRLLNVLHSIGQAGTTRKRDAIKVAFRSLYKEDEIRSLQDQLNGFRAKLNLHLVLSLFKRILGC